MTQVTGTYHVEKIKTDHLGDTDGFTDAQIDEIIRRQERAIAEALEAQGYTVVWDDLRIWSTGHITGTNESFDRDDEMFLEQVVADAGQRAMDAWYADGCPED
jgi:muconolactone delta-isomerase